MLAKDTYVSRQVGTLSLSHVRLETPMARVRAAVWWNAMARLGNYPPLFVVHDIGALLTAPRGVTGWSLGSNERAMAQLNVTAGQRALLKKYTALLEMLAGSEVVERLSGWHVRDDLIAVVLSRALGDLCRSWRTPMKAIGGLVELPVDIGFYERQDIAAGFSEWDPKPVWDFLELLIERSLHVYTAIELIDIDTIRLLGIFREDSAHGAERIGKAVDVVDLLSALASPEASDVANFSLDLLPSILETKRASGAQTFSVDGYSSIERKGHLDSLMLSELAFEQDMFEQKVVDHELLYYGHERQQEDERRLHYILVDSSASMRGKRQVFARGLAIALAKKLALQGDEIWFRFFDSRLHELFKTARGAPFPVPYLLSFRSERGRNYTKVFQELVIELTRLRRDQKRHIALHLITHGQCHIPPELAAALAQECYLYGTIILPSKQVTLDFLPMLHKYQVVDSTVFQSRTERRDRALHIVGDASKKDGPRVT
jgi:hypothetical protein